MNKNNIYVSVRTTEECTREEFRDIKGFEGYYQVSNLGNVKTLSRSYFNGHSGATEKKILERLKAPVIQKNGYHSVSISNGKITKRFTIHRLVAMAFLENPENKKCVNHKDGNKANNCVSNLEWATHKENNDHANKTGLRKYSYNRWNNSLTKISI